MPVCRSNPLRKALAAVASAAASFTIAGGLRLPAQAPASAPDAPSLHLAALAPEPWLAPRWTMFSFAQEGSDPPGSAATGEAPSAPILSVAPHSEDARYWVSGQANVILQGHRAFAARYSGPNSFTNWAQWTTTHVLTLYTGYQLTHTTEVFADLEDATGNGDGNANGLAGYINLDSVRLVQGVALSKSPYLARFMLRQIIPLSSDHVDADRDELDLATSLPVRRLEFRLGKFDLADFFDVNSYGSDSHLQFLNWTADNNGAYDYAADTRGYTDGAMLEYDDHWWTLRYAEALMPKIANGQYLDADVARARAENVEFEVRGKRIAHREGVVRLLGYLNHGDMGNYHESVEQFLEGKVSTPEITATQEQGRHRYGFGLNFEQEINPQFSIFGRLGWSDGHNESFCYTEDDRTVELGAFATGRSWRRSSDHAGAVFIANGIVAAHQQYLALGGLGFLLGDGALSYSPEKVFEGFYTAHLWRGFFASYDFQHINDPGYNQARGPVSVSAFRFHTDF
jgi:high affinity Mn2+ porin